MKVVFWGGSHRCGTTSSMAAVASYLSLHSSRRSICVQPKEGGTDLELFFRPWESRTMLQEESTYYALEGMDYLIWQEQHHRLDQATIQETLVPLLGGRLSFLPSGAREKPGLYPAQTGELQRRILTRLETMADLVFIDLGTAKDGLADRMMELADVVVVNFCGQQRELENFFGQPSAVRKNVLYLLPNYVEDQVYNRNNLQRIYRVDPRKICNLPSNVNFAHACMHGRVDRFIQKSGPAQGVRRNGLFFEQLRYLSNLILEVGGYEG